jgi:hypothetical protein
MKTKNLKTRMKTKNLILMNHQSQILNLMNNQSPGVPLAIVGAVNQAQFFNVDQYHYIVNRQLTNNIETEILLPMSSSVLPNCLR